MRRWPGRYEVQIMAGPQTYGPRVWVPCKPRRVYIAMKLDGNVVKVELSTWSNGDPRNPPRKPIEMKVLLEEVRGTTPAAVQALQANVAAARLEYEAFEQSRPLLIGSGVKPQ